MRSTAALRRFAVSICAASLAAGIPAACKTSTASGTAAATDGGSGGTALTAADAGGSIARDIGEGAGTAAGNVASGVRSAGQGIADAGAAAAGAISGAATTAAEVAREAAQGASPGAASAMDGGAPAGAGSDAGETVPPSPPAAPRLSDAQIAAVALAANKSEIDAAQAARKKTKNAQVKRFAGDMIRDHTSANKQAAALVKRLALTPQDSETSRSLTRSAEDDLSNLKPLKGKEFDKAYAEQELARHRQVLAAFDEKLIPVAQNADLKSLLESVRSVVAEHLDQAQALADSLSK
jgi:putative membrane protein